MAILFLKKGEPITQEQGYLDLLLTPSVTLKAQLFNSCSYSQANRSTSKHLTPAKTRSLFHLPTKMEEAFSRSCRKKAVASIRSLYLCNDNSLWTKGGRSLELSCFAPSNESSLSYSISVLNCPPKIMYFCFPNH